MATTGIHALLTMLAEAGVEYIFGNPGTTELPLNDALIGHESIRYVLGLQEVPVMAMADGYAMASGKLGVVNLHAACGLGNALGMLYNAAREGTPLLVTAGQQDRRIRFGEPILGGDLVGVVRPWTKFAAEVDRIQDLPSAIRRAVQAATTPPTGPVFLSLPVDVQMEEAELDLRPAAAIDRRVRPSRAALEQAAALLRAAKQPAILAGSRVQQADAVAELVRVAELLGAPVFSESSYNHGRLAFPADHPLYAQVLPQWSPDISARLRPYDALLVVGMDLLRAYVYHAPEEPLPAGIKLVQIDENPFELNKNHPLNVAVWGDTKASLAELAELLAEGMAQGEHTAAAGRAADIARQHDAWRAALVDKSMAETGERPLTPLTLMNALARVLPDDVAVVEEAVTTTGNVLERLGALKNTSGYFAHRGWALGWGLGVAIGAKLAWPDRPVLAILGDGAAMYGIQGLWTAARYKLPVTFVIANNRQYEILKAGSNAFNLPAAGQGRYLGLDIDQPAIDYVGLAKSLGVDAARVEEPEAITEAVSASLAGDIPRLIEVPIQPRVW
jgi:benzoylformate decarboxylase